MAQLLRPLVNKFPAALNCAFAGRVARGESETLTAITGTNRSNAPRRKKVRRGLVIMFDQRCIIYLSSICYDAYGVNDIIGVIMQPNDQNQQPQNPSAPSGGYMSSSGAEVPEYLHMEPVADPVVVQEKRRKRKKLIVFIIALALLLMVAGGIVYWYIQHNNPQASFYKQLEASMQASYIQRKYTFKTKNETGNNGTVLETVSDFSDVKKPQTRLAYAELRDGKETAYTETINGKDTAYYGEFLQESERLKALGMSQSVWYKLLSGSQKQQNLFNTIFDRWKVLPEVNTTLGTPTIGGYSASTVAMIMDEIKTSGAYEVKSVKKDTIRDKEVTIYSIAVNTTKLSDTYADLAKNQGLTAVDKGSFLSVANIDSEVQMAFDAHTGKLTKVSYATKRTVINPPFNVEIDVTYPTASSITTPSSAEDFSKTYQQAHAQ